MNKANELLEKIKLYNTQYRLGTPIVSDEEYNGLVENLRRVDPNNEWFKAIEPSPVKTNRKVKLPIPMKSLDKIKNIEEFCAWATSLGLDEKSKIVITPKFDGVSILHDETTGMAYSRGGADNEGQDCSAHFSASTGITNCESELKMTFGEFVFSKQTWKEHFEDAVSFDTGEKYKSPRNTAAGLINRDEPAQQLQHIDFFRYGADNASILQFDTYEKFYMYLCHTFNQQLLFQISAIKDVSKEMLRKLYDAWSNEYYIDGLVIYVDDLSVWLEAGRHKTTGNPNYAIAYKDPDFTETFETTVNGVVWKISKSGAFKPVISIAQVNTGDCNMESPTGYNASWVFDNNIAKGAKVLVTRSGGVIPKIIKTLTPATKEEKDKLLAEISICPHCGEKTQWNKSKKEICCCNSKCKGIVFSKIMFFFKTLGADGVGEETLMKIFNAGYTTLFDILHITFEDLIDIDGFGDATANQLISEINKIKSGVVITKLMHASDCFEGIGQNKAESILSQLSKEDLFDIYNGSFHTWKNNEHLQTCSFFQNANVTLKSFMMGLIPFYEFVSTNRLKILPLQQIDKKDGVLSGVCVCFTGARVPDLERKIEDLGGTIANNVSKNTTCLVTSDKNSQSSKSIKAHKLGIPIYTVDELKHKYNL